jgi:hypothetical protein
VAKEYFEQTIYELCSELNKAKDKPIVNLKKGASGSAAGLPFEDWAYNKLKERFREPYRLFNTYDLAEYLTYNILNKTSLSELRGKTWWVGLQQLTEETIQEIRLGRRPKFQQALGDLILQYGDDINTVALLNIKSSELGDDRPQGRPPNIVSAYRLLEFLAELIDEKYHLIDKVAIYFLGFYYKRIDEEHVSVDRCYLRNLFKLDVKKAPPINFDAAIQIQWHIMDMVEKEQSLLDFAEQLAEKYLEEWRAFTNTRTRKIERTIDNLRKAIKKYKSQITFI